MKLDPEVNDAIIRGYPTARERRTWGQSQWTQYNTHQDAQRATENRAADEAWENNPLRLRERIDALEVLVQRLLERNPL